MTKALTLALIAVYFMPIHAAESRQPARNTLEHAAVEHLIDQFEYIDCSHKYFVYGVGYIDGSYIERIFVVKDPPGGQPDLKVEFRGEEMGILKCTATEQDMCVLDESTKVQFTLDLKVKRFNDAVFNKSWQLSGAGLRASPRFAHTSWFGEIHMVGEQWQVDWQGYRKPMLPASVTDNADKICALFAISQQQR